ncbi:MAG: GGDEF domain-containing protein [Pseudomonadales bacterium]|nr:GGDEF domain-containing protein [Pseudomonadales bacterium]
MLSQDNDSRNVLDVEQIELKGFSRSIAEIEWLLLLLVILYYVAPGSNVSNPFGMVLSMLGFAGFVLLFHYVNYNAPQYRWKLAIETWVMIGFITWTLWNTGSTESPLFNLYLLVIISSAITLGKMVTFLEIALIGAFYFFLAHHSGLEYSIAEFSQLMIYFTPFVLVAYIATMLAADVHYGRKMFKALSETDEMTKLLNKRSFNPMFSKAAEVAVKYAHPLSAMMIDADNLKQVNDVHGHAAGDQLIIRIAEIIQDSLRTSDIICRYGGDEFVALLPQLSAERAIEAGERLRSAVANMSFDADGKRIMSTVSIGIATWPDNVHEINELLEKADETLYESKRTGRNRVSSYGSFMKQPVQEQENREGGRQAERVLE